MTIIARARGSRDSEFVPASAVIAISDLSIGFSDETRRAAG